MAALRWRSGAVLALAWLLSAAAAGAQPAGTIAETEGNAEVGPVGATRPATMGAMLGIGEPLRTARAALLRLVLSDGSVVLVGPESELAVVERQGARTRLRLQRGALRLLVGDGGAAVAQFQVDTPTALARVRGTEFMITFDPVADVSQVVGIGGTVAVHSVLDPAARGVLVTTAELTTVARGRYPTPPQKLTETVFRQYLDSLAFIGGGRSVSLALGDPLLAGGSLPVEDQVGAAAAAAEADLGRRAVGSPPYPEAIRDQWGREVGAVDTPAQSIAGELGVEF